MSELHDIDLLFTRLLSSLPRIALLTAGYKGLFYLNLKNIMMVTVVVVVVGVHLAYSDVFCQDTPGQGGFSEFRTLL